MSNTYQNKESGKATLKDVYDVGTGKKKSYNQDLVNDILRRMRKRRMEKRGLLPERGE